MSARRLFCLLPALLLLENRLDLRQSTARAQLAAIRGVSPSAQPPINALTFRAHGRTRLGLFGDGKGFPTQCHHVITIHS